MNRVSIYLGNSKPLAKQATVTNSHLNALETPFTISTVLSKSLFDVA